MILEGEITIPYKWTTGPVAGRFLTEIRDNARIVGGCCSECGRVYALPPDVCGECFKPLTEWRELSGEGTLVASTTVHKRMPWSPIDPPYTIGLVRLDGADTELIHMVEPGLEPGARVRARFKDARKGSLLDIEMFASIDDTGADEKQSA